MQLWVSGDNKYLATAVALCVAVLGYNVPAVPMATTDLTDTILSSAAAAPALLPLLAPTVAAAPAASHAAASLPTPPVTISPVRPCSGRPASPVPAKTRDSGAWG